MNKLLAAQPGVALPLDSYRLIERSSGIACYLCDCDNTHASERCRRCAAPLAIAHQTNVDGVRPGMLAVIGNPGSGKTVYLGMLLDMLARETAGLRVSLRGAFSVAVQENTITALAEGRFPPKTPNEPDRWNWAHVQLEQLRPGLKTRHAQLVIPDLAGEVVADELEHPQSHEGVEAVLARSTGALVLLDAPRLSAGDHEEIFFGQKLFAYLDEIVWHDAKPDWRGRVRDARRPWRSRAISIVLTKADECEPAMADPARFVAEHAPGMWQVCVQRFAGVRIFAAGVAGACAISRIPHEGLCRVPLRVEPRGIVEPFTWIVDHLPSAVG